MYFPTSFNDRLKHWDDRDEDEEDPVIVIVGAFAHCFHLFLQWPCHSLLTARSTDADGNGLSHLCTNTPVECTAVCDDT